jgi:hypothetical protein
MTMREIVDTMLAAYGVTEAVAKQYKDLQSGLRALLKSHVGKTVERVGEGTLMRWKVIG